jgi:hypothetical protein
MERVLRHFGLKSLILLASILTLAQSSSATTVIVPSDDEMIIGARLIVRGKVVAVESSFDENQKRIYTYVTVKVQESIKGEITERFVVLKELGGQVGEHGLRVFGNAQFARGERVLLYLDTWKDGSLRTYQMYLGKFSITEDKTTGKQFVVRSAPDDNVSVRPNTAQSSERITDRMELSIYMQMVRGRLEANWERSQSFQETYYRDVPLLSQPGDYNRVKSQGELEPQWTYISSTHPRWFEPDTGQPVTFVVNPNSAPQPNIENDVNAAMNAWSTVPSCALRVLNGGMTSDCSEGVGLNLIQFSGCDGRWAAGGGCSGVLALGGLSWFSGQTIVINGVTFVRATAGFVSLNPNAACYFTNHCNVQEVLTHELGHAMGLGHSGDQSATMAAFAHFDGRCASAMTDDMAAVQFIYPGTGGGPGPLTVTTSSLANGTVGSTYSQTLQRSGGTAPYTWSIVAGLGNLPAGLSLNANTGVISGTTSTTGTSNFTVRVTDAPGATANKALSIVVNAGGGAALDSQFVSQTVPTTLNPGQSFNSNIKFLNTGTQTWSGVAFYLASQNPSLNQTWGGNGVSLSSFVVSPGQQLDVTFSAVAPTTPGTYNFQWQTYQNGGVGFFGQMSANVVVQVGSSPPPPPNRPDTIGLYNSINAEFDLKNSNSTGAPDLAFSYGPALGWTPLVGDWNNDGADTVGLYDPATSRFFLKNSNAPGAADMVFNYGPSGAGWLPVVGDWNGDGFDTVGLYDPTTSRFFLKNSNSAGAADLVFSYGPAGAGWLPLAGDWDGDSSDTVGLYNPGTGTFFLKNSNAAGPADLTFAYGPGGAGWIPLAGDWNGDGTDTIGAYNPASSNFFLKNSNSAGPADMVFGYGLAGSLKPIVGDWDGL